MPTCIPAAHGVPALPGPPNWWDTTQPEPNYWNKFDDNDDPRWNGSSRKGFDGGGLEHMSFRALHAVEGGQTYLYLAWDVKVDPSADLNGDGIFLGLQRSGGDAYIIKIVAFSSADHPDASATPSRAVLKKVGTAWVQQPEYTWVGKYARSWLKPSGPGVTTNKWAIHVRVPLLPAGDINNDGIFLGNVAAGATFSLWSHVDVDGLGGATIAYAWPRGALITADKGGNLTDVYPDPSTWDTITVSSSAGCGTGISLRPQDIGTTNIDPATNLPAPHLILFEYPVTVNAPVNHFVVKVNHSPVPPGTNVPPVAAHGIRATARIANWGTQPDWNNVPNPTTTLWREVLPLVAKENAASIPAGSAGTIEFDWTLTDAEAKEFASSPPVRRSHQCFLVQLSGGGVDFINDSAYRNMDVSKASETVSEADVSVVGLEELVGTSSRDVYLFVDARNMPEVIPRPRDGDQDKPRSRLSTHGELPPDSYEDIALEVPTFVVHAYHDTGIRRRKLGVVRKVLEPQTSFGYFVAHEGALYGWDHALTGPGIRKVGPNFYRIPVPNNGSVTVTTRISALERPRPWWWALWKLLLKLLDTLTSRFRKLLGQ